MVAFNDNIHKAEHASFVCRFCQRWRHCSRRRLLKMRSRSSGGWLLSSLACKLLLDSLIFFQKGP